MKAARAALLLLTDGRTPIGGHAHSGGVEAAVVAGDVTTVERLDAFLQGRLATTGVVAAAFAAAACTICAELGGAAPAGVNGDGGGFNGTVEQTGGGCGAGRGQGNVEGTETDDKRDGRAGGGRGHVPDGITEDRDRDGGEDTDGGTDGQVGVRRRDRHDRDDDSRDHVLATLAYLDEELDARTPSPAQRSASRTQGRALLRTARTAWPGLRTPTPAPHHPIALGVAAAYAGLEPVDAALAAAYAAVSGPASAATRLLGLDPLAVTALLARLAPDVEAVASTATASAAHAAVTQASAAAPASAVHTSDVHASGSRAVVTPAPGSASDVGYRSLPAITAVRLDLLAEAHRRADVRMFAS